MVAATGRPAAFSLRFLPLITVALAITIFAVDTLTALPDAVAVLYVVVVLLSVNFVKRRGLLVVALACCGAAIFSYFVERGFPHFGEPLVRLLVSLSAIGIISLLAASNLSAAVGLQKQAHLLDLTHDAIFTRGMDEVITYWNRGAEALYGWSSDEAIGKSAPLLLRTVAPAPQDVRNALLAEDRWAGEMVRARRDGRQVVVAARWSLQRDDRGDPVAILETDTDITESKRAEEGRLDAEAQLARVSRAVLLGELTASIAHEVNQPLAAIVTNGEVGLRLLDCSPPDLAEVRALLADMIAGGRRASDVIQRLRAMFRKTDPEKALIDINHLIHDLVPLVRAALIDQGVTLRLDLAQTLPPVLGDRIQLQQVIINLVVNGAQAMSSIAGRPRDLSIRSHVDEAGRVTVAVSDTGIGIDDATAKRLFEAFFTTKPGGMGMGLPICRSIIESHGGQLRGSQNHGPGATFEFTLRAQQEAPL